MNRDSLTLYVIFRDGIRSINSPHSDVFMSDLVLMVMESVLKLLLLNKLHLSSLTQHKFILIHNVSFTYVLMFC